MPGFKPEEIDIKVIGNTLTLTAERKAEEERKGERWLRREIRYGKVERTVQLPAEVKPEQAEARMEHGILTLRLPKAEAVTPKRIPIRTVA